MCGATPDAATSTSGGHRPDRDPRRHRPSPAAGHGRRTLQAGVQDLAEWTARGAARRGRGRRDGRLQRVQDRHHRGASRRGGCDGPLPRVRLAGDALDRCRAAACSRPSTFTAAAAATRSTPPGGPCTPEPTCSPTSRRTAWKPVSPATTTSRNLVSPAISMAGVGVLEAACSPDATSRSTRAFRAGQSGTGADEHRPAGGQPAKPSKSSGLKSRCSTRTIQFPELSRISASTP